MLKQGLVVDPGEKDLYNTLGGVYSEMGRHDEAIATDQRYVQLAPDEPNTHDSRGLGYEWAGRYDEAIQEYNRALALKPNFEIAMVHLGNTYFQQGCYRAAIEEYQRYIQAAPMNAERSRGYGCVPIVELRVGNLTAAKQAATNAPSYGDPTVVAAYFLALQRNDLGLAHRLKDNFERSARPERGSRGAQRNLFYWRGLYALQRAAGSD